MARALEPPPISWTASGTKTRNSSGNTRSTTYMLARVNGDARHRLDEDGDRVDARVEEVPGVERARADLLRPADVAERVAPAVELVAPEDGEREHRDRCAPHEQQCAAVDATRSRADQRQHRPCGECDAEPGPDDSGGRLVDGQFVAGRRRPVGDDDGDEQSEKPCGQPHLRQSMCIPAILVSPRSRGNTARPRGLLCAGYAENAHDKLAPVCRFAATGHGDTLGTWRLRCAVANVRVESGGRNSEPVRRPHRE